MDIENVAPGDRGKMMLKWRTTLGWTNVETARRLGVTPRTVTSDESGNQVVPESRWRLFVHEVSAEIKSEAAPELVVVVSEQQLPLDVVSSHNYAGFALDENGRTGMIASYSVNRLTGAPEVHRQLFLVQSNTHVMDAIERWEAARQDATPNRAAFEMQRWLMRRVLEGEMANPELAELKAAVTEAKAELDRADSPTEVVRAERARKLDMAVVALMEAITKAARK